jgi:hypothetical protein
MEPVPFAIFALVVLFLLYQVVGGLASFILLGGAVNEENVNAVRWTTLGGQALLLLLPTILLVRARHRGDRGFLRLRLPDHRQLFATVAGVFSLSQVLQGYLLVQDAIPLPVPEGVREIMDEIKNMIEETYRLLVTSSTVPEFLFVVLVVALVPAITEELLFRGLVQRNLERAAGGMRAAVVTGIIFGLYHLSPFTVVPLAVLGTYFGFLVYRSNNLSIAVSAHFFNNFFACVAAYIGLDSDVVAIAPSGDVSAALIAANSLLFLLLFGVSTAYFIRITDRD